MSANDATLSDADAANTATFYGEQAIHPDSAKNRALASTAERIFFGGIGPGLVPPCTMCHGAAGQRGMPMMGRGMMGMMGSGMSANVPNLNGQHATYVVDQSSRFAGGERLDPMMSRIAAALSKADRKAVAECLAGHP